jgi:hypothetical protein
MEIPMEAQVQCTDGACGRSEYVLINPASENITHVVVREDSSHGAEYIVPLGLVDEMADGRMRLRCSRAELEKLAPFAKTKIVKQEVSEIFMGSRGAPGDYGIVPTNYYWPYVTVGKTEYVPEIRRQVPRGELAMGRDLRIEATDGSVGRVDEFVVNPDSGHITHVVMHEGRLFRRRDVAIPISDVGDTHEKTLFLKLTKAQVGSLPTYAAA